MVSSNIVSGNEIDILIESYSTLNDIKTILFCLLFIIALEWMLKRCKTLFRSFLTIYNRKGR